MTINITKASDWLAQRGEAAQVLKAIAEAIDGSDTLPIYVHESATPEAQKVVVSKLKEAGWDVVYLEAGRDNDPNTVDCFVLSHATPEGL